MQFVLPIVALLVSVLEIDPNHQRDKPIHVKHDAGVVVKVMFIRGETFQILPEDHFVRLDRDTVIAAPPGSYAAVGGGDLTLFTVEGDRAVAVEHRHDALVEAPFFDGHRSAPL